MPKPSDFDRRPFQGVVTQEPADRVAKPLLVDFQGYEVTNVGNALTSEGIAADAAGKKYIRAGSILIPSTTIDGAWRLAQSVAEVNGDGAGVPAATAVRILSHTQEMSGVQPGEAVLVGTILSARFYDKTMPSLANNAVEGLEPAVFPKLNTFGYKFKSQQI